MGSNRFIQEDFRGYKQSTIPKIDEVLARTDPNTACGEFLRRYWHPVALTSEVSEIPREIRILGEDLVIFKTSKGNIGLVHKACPHRRASMAYGKTEDKGIRCCYHGWLFSPNGEILETPGEDPESKQAKKLRETFKLGAYPIIEFNGLVFSYLGPMDKIPEFPHYDSFEIPGNTSSPYRINYNCNWIQVLDAIMDPLHTSFLHGQSSGVQFSEGFAEVGEIDFYERGIQYLGCNTRRINDNVWVRVNELILPNFTQAGAAFAADGTKSNNLEILARIKSTAVNGCEPEVMGLGPIGASKKALSRAGLKSSDLDIIELNEAFASQSLACMKDLELDEKSVNLDGGAIALGHPLGATGARITGKAAQLLKREGKKFALATQCIGLGQGIATVLEAVE